MKTEILSAEASDAIARVRLRPGDVKLFLSRIAAVVPHLEFECWGLSETTEEQLTEETGGKWAQRRNGRPFCFLFMKQGKIGISTWLNARSGKISDDEFEFLDHMVKEASGLLDAAVGISVPISDFGMHAVSKLLEKISATKAEQIGGYLKFLRSMSGETYENQRLSYGLILRKKKMRNATAVLEFDNKRFKRLTDGFLTALALDCNGNIMELLPLDSDREREAFKKARPWWLAALADTSAREDGVGIALTRSGDILVAYQQELFLSQRSGEWRIWRHDVVVDVLRAWQPSGPRGDLDRVIDCLYRVALDMSFRRSGGLLVVAESQEKALKIISSKGDQIGASNRSEAEKALDASVSSKSVLDIDRRVLGDLACLDGAIVVDRNGGLIAYGAMVKSVRDSDSQGSRTRAAIGASEFGLAIKISADGGIVFYLGKEVLLSL